jgi:hypothetical protein
MVCFDYSGAAKEAGISAGELQQLCQLLRREFPADDMLYELHVLRACMAVRDGVVRLDELLRAEPAGQVL